MVSFEGCRGTGHEGQSVRMRPTVSSPAGADAAYFEVASGTHAIVASEVRDNAPTRSRTKSATHPVRPFRAAGFSPGRPSIGIIGQRPHVESGPTHRCQAFGDVADAQHADRAPVQFPADIGAAVDRLNSCGAWRSASTGSRGLRNGPTRVACARQQSSAPRPDLAAPTAHHATAIPGSARISAPEILQAHLHRKLNQMPVPVTQMLEKSAIQGPFGLSNGIRLIHSC